MIYSLNGKVVHTEINLAVIECAGVGFACRTTANTLSRIKPGENATLLTYLAVREDAVELFGFADSAELSAFKMLISVSGVGPKAALSVLSDLNPGGFALAIAAGDAKRLTAAPGIGKKIAERIVLELKEKVAGQTAFTSGEWADSARIPVGNSGVGEAMSGLMVLGFSSAEAGQALSGLDTALSGAELIKLALKRINK
ncbi:Holliday junction branch migration protein RuvA [Clostridia bacterium]|nr:Holliday junction branch migration protein RuvA [Clostridia bacterium]